VKEFTPKAFELQSHRAKSCRSWELSGGALTTLYGVKPVVLKTSAISLPLKFQF